MTSSPHTPITLGVFPHWLATLVRRVRSRKLQKTVALLVFSVAAGMTKAQTAPPAAAGRTASTAETVYLVLLGEMQLRARETGIGYSLLLEAARKSADPRLYQRAMSAALESRAVAAAIDAARAWAVAMPTASEPQRALVQLLLTDNKAEQSAAHLDKLLAMVPDAERNALIDQVGQTYARAPDRAVARRVATNALQPWTQHPHTAASAWAAQGTLALGAGLHDQALAMLQRAVASPTTGGAPGILAVDLLNAKVLGAGPMLQTYLAQTPVVPVAVRIAYMRYLLDTDQPTEAHKQLELATTQTPEAPDPWLLLGTLNLQNNQPDSAEPQLLRFLELVSQRDNDPPLRGVAQAYFALAQIAEYRLQFETATAWLDRIEAPEDGVRVQMRRASLLARQGRTDEARLVIQQTQARQPSDARMKLLAEVQLLKDAGRLADAASVLAAATGLTQDDPELAYEQAMLADRLGQTDEMERLLRALMARKPDYHHAYNALGYALAERNTRLPEAKALIIKALEMAPGDPFITDSLGWVEYRLGNLGAAIQLLKQAFEKRPDIEIAVHLAEVLWVKGDQEAAQTMFRRARELQADSPVLKEALQRLGVPR